mgnify:CR=1 FL=1
MNTTIKLVLTEEQYTYLEECRKTLGVPKVQDVIRDIIKMEMSMPKYKGQGFTRDKTGFGDY